MAIKPRLYDGNLFDSAATDVSTGRYKLYENDFPDYLREDDQLREPSANTCKMIVATIWSGGPIEDVTPYGVTYFVFNYQDHRHSVNDPHFQKDVQVYTHNSNSDAIRFTINKDLHDHYIDALATGTSLAYLRGEYRLPVNPEGSIEDLISGGTSIEPYPR